MPRSLWVVLALAGLVTAACGGANAGISSATPNPSSYDETQTDVRAAAAIADGTGKNVGIAHLRETRLGVRVQVDVTGLPPGEHGAHIHAAGKCEGPDFATAAGHFNVNGGIHGVAGTPGSHAGDLPNLVVGADGKGSLLFYSPFLSLNPAMSNGLTFGAGTAIVIHAAKDDEHTDPAGNSGARIACGVVKKL